MRLSTIAFILASLAPQHGQALNGIWIQSGWKLCTPVPQLSADQIDLPIRELSFDGDGRFSVTWRPFETYRDYWGRYRYDANSRAIDLEIEGGNFVPKDFVGRGTAVIAGDTLTLTGGLRLGTRDAKNRADICELTFTRSVTTPAPSPTSRASAASIRMDEAAIRTPDYFGSWARDRKRDLFGFRWEVRMHARSSLNARSDIRLK
jgi:hypothetical protein